MQKLVNDTFANNFDELVCLREKVDSLLLDFVFSLSSADCLKEIKYTTTEGLQVRKCVFDVCQHLFNHQTHHRGQLTCILSQLDLDFGCTDLPVIVPEGINITNLST